MFSPEQGGWLFLFVDVILVALLAGGLIYGWMMYRSRSKDPVVQRVRDEATRDLYQAEDRRRPD